MASKLPEQASQAFLESATSRARQLFNEKRGKAEPLVPQPIEVEVSTSSSEPTLKPNHIKVSTAPSEVVKSSATVQWRENRRQTLNAPQVTFRCSFLKLIEASSFYKLI
jgi:hypothetical protein